MKLPQLSVRDLFWLVLVVGMGCAWWNQLERARECDDWKHKFELLSLFCEAEGWRFHWARGSHGWEGTRFDIPAVDHVPKQQ